MKTIALYENNSLVLDALVQLVSSWGYEVAIKTTNCKDMLKCMKKIASDLLLLHANEAEDEQLALVKRIKKRNHRTKIVVLGEEDLVKTQIKFYSLGVDAMLEYNCNPKQLKQKILQLLEIKKNNRIERTYAKKNNFQFSEREKHFIELSCTDFSYAQIADLLCVSIRTVDNYRDAVYEKMEVHSRNSLIMFAIRHNLVSIS